MKGAHNSFQGKIWENTLGMEFLSMYGVIVIPDMTFSHHLRGPCWRSTYHTGDPVYVAQTSRTSNGGRTRLPSATKRSCQQPNLQTAISTNKPNLPDIVPSQCSIEQLSLKPSPNVCKHRISILRTCSIIRKNVARRRRYCLTHSTLDASAAGRSAYGRVAGVIS